MSLSTKTAGNEARSVRVTVEAAIRRHRLITPGDRLVVAVSGGPDSICLLHILHALRTTWRLSLHVAHVNHGLRGTEADRDAAFVGRVADGLGLPWTVETADVGHLARAGRLSVEAAARDARYRLLERAAGAVGAQRIAVGHTANDQAETVLMRLLRGAGRGGLRGIPVIRPVRRPVRRTAGRPVAKDGDRIQTVADGPVSIIRPLLHLTRDQVLAYLQSHDLPWCEDSTNRETASLRNRIRHDLLPTLSAHNPNLIETLGREADILTEEDALLDALADDALDALCSQAPSPPRPAPSPLEGEGWGEGVILDAAGLSRLPRALARRVIRLAVQRILIPGPGQAAGRTLTFRQVEAVLDLAGGQGQGRSGGRHSLSHSLVVEREYAALRLGHLESCRHDSRRGPASSPVPSPETPVLLAIPGETSLPAWGLTVRTTRVVGSEAAAAENPVQGPPQNPTMSAVFDADRLPLPLIVRGRRPGDWLCPAGMGGHRKRLQDFFVDAKVPRRLRDRMPLLVGPSGVVWVIGRRLDGRFLATGATRTALAVTCRPVQIDGGPEGG